MGYNKILISIPDHNITCSATRPLADTFVDSTQRVYSGGKKNQKIQTARQ